MPAPDNWRDTIYYRYIDGGHGVAQHSAIRTNTHKLLFFDQPRTKAEEESLWELYDLEKDPQEMTNLASDIAHSSKLESMKKLFAETKKFYDDTNEDIWKKPKPHRFAPEDYIIERRRKAGR